MTNKNIKKILILYLQISLGHRRAAEAVAAALQKRDPSLEVRCLDFFEMVGEPYRQTLSHLYLALIRYRPGWWNRMYDNARYAPSVGLVRDWLADLNEERVRHVIGRESPGAVICTQAIPAVVAGNIRSALRERDGSAVFDLYAVATDFEAHLYWIHPEIAVYFVASPFAAERLGKRGLDPGKIVVSGIPIDPAFEPENLPAKEEARRRLGWEEGRPAVLLMGGSLGLGLSKELVERLLNGLSRRIRLAALTGSNEELREDLAGLTVPEGRSLSVVGPIENGEIPLFMRASDLLISKPGGLTMAEALACGLPMIASHPLPGQERRNARYLERMGAGVRALDLERTLRHAERLLTDEPLRQAMAFSAKEAARPNAAGEIAARVLGQEESQTQKGVSAS